MFNVGPHNSKTLDKCCLFFFVVVGYYILNENKCKPNILGENNTNYVSKMMVSETSDTTKKKIYGSF